MRIALLTYRGNPHSGGQGVYVRYLSKALVELGHTVEVFSGQPYPDLCDGVAFNPVPSLDLYRPDDPFRVPRLSEFRGAIDVLEFGLMCTAAFPEPLTFSLRAVRALRNRGFEVVHDNQSLGYGLLAAAQQMPVVATVHHPCSIDKRVEIDHADTAARRASLQRWYSFTRMQARVAKRLPALIAVSETGRADIATEFGIDPSGVTVVHNGVDAELFRPLPDVQRVPGRIVTTTSSEAPLKGLVFLIEALAKVRTERPAELVVVGKAHPDGAVARAIERYGVHHAVTFRPGIDYLSLVELYATSEVSVVPSLYEGFSLPAVEAMSCAVPVVATTAGALPEVVGGDGETALLVAPRDAGQLAAALRRLLEDEDLRSRLGRAGRRRVLSRFTWASTAAATARVYEEAIARC